MANGTEVLEMLCPEGGWIIVENDFNSIIWVDDRPKCTEAEFKAGFAKIDVWKAEQKTKAQADRAALLTKLGMTADEVKLLLN